MAPRTGVRFAAMAARPVIRGRVTSVRPAADADADLLARWHADPETRRFWGGRTYTVDEVRARLLRERVDAWIIEAAGEPVGYVQSWWGDEEPRRGGLDGFIVPEHRGRGLMPDAARALATALLDAGWTEVTVDPYAWNARALRGWSNAGFVEVARHEPDEEHDAPWVLMRFATIGT